VLTITPEALAVIRRVTDNRRLDRTAGLRIARRADPSAPLRVRAVNRPQPGDHVVERAGARLYLDPSARRRVDSRELDAVDRKGHVQFILRASA
jgi:iron-sulfur cluster assembly protein